MVMFVALLTILMVSGLFHIKLHLDIINGIQSRILQFLIIGLSFILPGYFFLKWLCPPGEINNYHYSDRAIKYGTIIIWSYMIFSFGATLLIGAFK